MPRARHPRLLHPRVSRQLFSDFSLIDLLFMIRFAAGISSSAVSAAEARDKTSESNSTAGVVIAGRE